MSMKTSSKKGRATDQLSSQRSLHMRDANSWLFTSGENENENALKSFTVAPTNTLRPKNAHEISLC